MTVKNSTSTPIDEKGRVRFLKEWGGKWSEGENIMFCPLIFRRQIDLPDKYAMKAWYLQGTKEPEHSGWVNSPDEIRRKADIGDVNALDLRDVVYEVTLRETGDKKEYWRICIPKEVRKNNWMPASAGEVIVKHDPIGVSIWTTDAFNALVPSLVKRNT